MSEYTWSDTDGNGTLDTGIADTDGDGYADVAAHDMSGDGVIDAYQYDTDRDGLIGDEIRFDTTQDGVSDAIAYDYDENRVTDAYASEQTGWQPAALTQAPATTALTPTVMPTQGAYSSGPTGESMQMTFARLLERETDPFKKAQLTNAIELANIQDAFNPWTH